MQVLSLHKRLAEELELRTVLESALENSSGTLTNFPRHLPISVSLLTLTFEDPGFYLFPCLVLIMFLFHVFPLLYHDDLGTT